MNPRVMEEDARTNRNGKHVSDKKIHSLKTIQYFLKVYNI